MKDPVKVLVVAINGYGHYYLKTLLEETDCEQAVLVGVVDPDAERSKYYHAFREFGIPVCSRMNDYFLSGGKADLAVISSPPHFHVANTILALHKGVNVLCEKPVSGVLSEAEALIEKKNKSGKFVMIGYQWSFSEGIQNLKKDILSGIYGKPLRMKSMCLWPRDLSYFSRNSWAYKRYDAGGNAVMDNLFNNAMSHFIHNMLFLMGATMDSSAEPEKVEAITARAYPVETYDTGALRIWTSAGTELLFLGSHAAEKTVDPCFRVEFENGFIELKPGAATITGMTIGRNEFSYPSPDSDHQFKKLFRAIENVADPSDIICPVEAALPHVRVVDRVEKICGEGLPFAAGRLVNTGERIFAGGLDDLLSSCYKSFRMPRKDFTE